MEASTSSTSSPLSSLLSDPALLGAIRGLASGLTAEKGNREEVSDPPAAGVGGMDLSALLSNPALLQALPRLVSGLTAVTKEATETKENGEALPVSAPPTPPVRPTGSIPRNELLLSLKPFLSKERCEAVDMILRLSALGNVLRHLQ